MDNNIIDDKLIGNENNIVFYTDEDDNVNIEVVLQNENVWLNIESLTKLFKIKKRHIHFLKLFKINYILQLLEKLLQNFNQAIFYKQTWHCEVDTILGLK